jgi:hypothetical protein
VRFGYGYLEETFRWKQVRIEVVEPPKVQTPTEELVADLLSILNAAGRFYLDFFWRILISSWSGSRSFPRSPERCVSK